MLLTENDKRKIDSCKLPNKCLICGGEMVNYTETAQLMFTNSGILSANLHEVLVRTCSNCGHIDIYDLETLLNN